MEELCPALHRAIMENLPGYWINHDRRNNKFVFTTGGGVPILRIHINGRIRIQSAWGRRRQAEPLKKVITPIVREYLA